MDAGQSGQDMVTCDLCDTPAPPRYCDLCEVRLCKEHLSDVSTEHKVVPIKRQPNIKCWTHTETDCDLYCENCDVPVCFICINTDKHLGHRFTHARQKLNKNKEDLEKDLKELVEEICPKYEEIASDVQTEQGNLETRYDKLLTAADQQGEVWHQEINAIVNQRKSEIEEMKSTHLAILNNQADEITHSITKLKQIVLELKGMLDSKDSFTAFTYKSRNLEFRKLPPKFQVTSPIFSPQKINKDQLQEMFGSLSSLSIHKEQDGYTMKSYEAASSPLVKRMKSPEAALSTPVRPFLDEPRLVTSTDTWYQELRSVRCLSDDRFWITSGDCILNLLNLQGKLLTSVQTKSGNTPKDIAVTQNGDLVYTDTEARTVNILQSNHIREAINTWNMKPGNVCCTSSGDLLVILDSDDGRTPSKIIRYSGTAEIQAIQIGDQGHPLYSSGYYKYISENRNLDICVADNDAKAVVVVDQSGKLRFRYTGYSSNTEESFDPLGITTDSQGHILISFDPLGITTDSQGHILISFDPLGITTDSQGHILISDCKNDRIHILDQDGQFLQFIQDCDLHDPWGLCVDAADNLLVAEYKSGKVKQIKYT